jgi:DNA uptake lipoprotein
MKLLPFLFIWVVAFTACKTSFEKIQKSKDYEFKLSKANEYFDKKQYSRANTLYEELLTIYKGTKQFENIYYRYAYCYYYQRNYLAASYHFKNFVDLFPKSPKAEECEYLNALCLFKESPEYTLDQSNTVKAIGEMQSFITSYPDSKHYKEADKLIQSAREKLEVKDRYAAELYFKIREYRAASVAFEQVIRKFPDSPKSDYYQYMAIRSTYLFAGQSIPDKQQQRYARVVAEAQDFLEKYPNSPYKSEVLKLNSLSSQILKKISKS